MPEKRDAELHKNHRARLFARIDEYGLESLADHEVLEYLLFLTNARRDTNPLAHALLKRFGSLENVLGASEEELRQVEGVGPAAVRLLHLLPQLSRRCERARRAERLLLSTTEQRADYLREEFRGVTREQLMLVLLDDRFYLRRRIWIDSGSASAMEISIQKLAATAAQAGAAQVLLAHNHPGGIAVASRQDLFATRDIVRALGIVGIHVVDHLIVAGDETYSMKDSNQLPLFDFKTGNVSIPLPRF